MVDPNQLRIIGWSTKLRMAIDWPNRLHADDGWPFQLRSIASGRPDYINMATMVGCLNSEPWWLAGSTLYELPTMFLAKSFRMANSTQNDQWLAENQIGMRNGWPSRIHTGDGSSTRLHGMVNGGISKAEG